MTRVGIELLGQLKKDEKKPPTKPIVNSHAFLLYFCRVQIPNRVEPFFPIYQISNEVQKARVSKNTKSLIGLAPWGRGIEYWGKIPKVNHCSAGKRMEDKSGFWISRKCVGQK